MSFDFCLLEDCHRGVMLMLARGVFQLRIAPMPLTDVMQQKFRGYC